MRHPFVLVFVLSMHSLALLAALRPDLLPHLRLPRLHAAKPPELPKPAEPAPPPPEEVVQKRVVKAPPLPGEGTPIDTNAWLQRQAQARNQYVQRHFGPRIAQMLAAPDSGLDALADLARHGDAQALEAWSWRADECQSADHPPSGVLASTSSEKGSTTAPSTLRQFADSIVEARRDADAQLALTCAKANTDRALLEASYRELTNLDSPAGRQAAAELQYEQDGDLDRLIARLREVLGGDGDAAAQRALATHLLESADAAQREEGLALLRRLSDNDNDALSELAQCLGIGCGALAPRPDQVGDLVERSAELGFPWALEREIDDATRRSKDVETLGWSRYRQWLNAQGCFAAPSDLSLRFLLDDTQLEETLGLRIAPAQNLSANNIAITHVRRAGAAARHRAACD
jgi:hypothetical protein